MTVRWMDAPERHDYAAAEDYLSLLFVPSNARKLAGQLERTRELRTYKAKDILRASGLPALDSKNAHVAKDLEKIKKGEELSPILLVRGVDGLIIADGYHRVCASYYVDENTDIPCKIV